jgi:hypothetical protein
LPIQPAAEHDDPDAPDGVDPYPALSFAAVKWLNQRTGGPTGAYPDLTKVLTPVFYAQIDQSQPVAVLRTHREQTTAHLLRMFGSSGGVAEADEVLDFVERMDPDEPAPRVSGHQYLWEVDTRLAVRFGFVVSAPTRELAAVRAEDARACVEGIGFDAITIDEAPFAKAEVADTRSWVPAELAARLVEAAR